MTNAEDCNAAIDEIVKLLAPNDEAAQKKLKESFDKIVDYLETRIEEVELDLSLK